MADTEESMDRLRRILASPLKAGAWAPALAVAAMLSLNACAFTEEALMPSLFDDEEGAEEGEFEEFEEDEEFSAEAPSFEPDASSAPQAGVMAQTPAPQPQYSAPQPAVGQSAAQPSLGSGSFVPRSITPGADTGTFVGRKIQEMRGELQRLQTAIIQQNTSLQAIRGKVIEDSRRYHGIIAQVNAKLQVGTTPGNPVLVQQFAVAQAELDRLVGDVNVMNQLLNAVTTGSGMSAYLTESVQAAYSVSGALDEDHRQLAILEDEINRTSVLVERLEKELSEDVRRQTTYVAGERSNMNLMASGIQTGEIYGANLMNVALIGAGRGGMGPVAGTPAAPGGRSPLVVIRFDRADVAYEQALYNAVSQALSVQPNATFDLFGVAPAGGGEARVALNSSKSRRHAENVLRALIEMGLPSSRVAVSGQVSAQAIANEVHLYVR